uniref:Uncharacterized protein n=1 Tax=Candidatus Kentrum sp. SD TaxID=2126332 RepID=A0A450YBP6_9GAMM|nr:MAG: hypothetical protein BECKSD772F_GA0070984_103017 [Candidatus Kentron sp. SD]VFK43200.1 MAG: hypothetical protein BECKSD772E_GA0070983_102317 [Candidatus Kentron sp. SD]
MKPVLEKGMMLRLEFDYLERSDNMKRNRTGFNTTLVLFLSLITISMFIGGCAADRYITREKQRQAVLESAYQRASEKTEAAEARRVQMEETKAAQQAEQHRLRTEIAQLESEIRQLNVQEEALRDELRRLRTQGVVKPAKILKLEREIADVQQTTRQKQRTLDTLRNNL